jgi:translation initiation factor 1A
MEKKEDKLKIIEDLKGGEKEVELKKIQLPQGNEVIGIVEQRLGGPRVRVKCFDGKTRIGRIPGRLKRRIWIKEGDYVLCKPWELQPDEKCDIIFKYSPIQVKHLKEKGIINEVEDEFFEDEF